MFRSFALSALIAAVPAGAATIDLSIGTAPYTFASFDASGNAIAGNAVINGNSVSNDDVSFWTATTTFTVPTGATNLTALVGGFASDDRAVALLNGADTGFGVGIFGPGPGRFIFTPGGAAQDYTFLANGVDQQNPAPVSLSAGTYTLTFVVNNTNAGIAGDTLTGGPSNLTFSGSLSYDESTGGVPETATWTMMIAGFAMVGIAARRRTLASAD